MNKLNTSRMGIQKRPSHRDLNSSVLSRKHSKSIKEENSNSRLRSSVQETLRKS